MFTGYNPAAVLTYGAGRLKSACPRLRAAGGRRLACAHLCGTHSSVSYHRHCIVARQSSFVVFCLQYGIQ